MSKTSKTISATLRASSTCPARKDVFFLAGFASRRGKAECKD